MMATPKGFKHSPETRARMSATHKARGFTISPEHREKLMAGQREAAKTPEYREAMSQAKKGKRPSAETRAKMSAAHKGKVRTPEHCAAISAGKKGIATTDTRDPEIREKNRQGQLRRYADPEERRKRGELTRQGWLRGDYDKKHPCWGNAGVHAGVKMHCLNSEGGFARDLDSEGILWHYEPRRFKLSWCTYRPDFYLPEFDIWVEVKGYPQQPGQWLKKVETFRRETGKTLIVVFMSELSSPKYEVGESDDHA